MSNRAFIFVNGEMRDAKRVQAMIVPGDFLVAADNGLDHLLEMGLAPNLVIGDLDSASDEALAKMKQLKITIERYPPEKNETDLELALRRVVQAGYRVIKIVAGLGGRLDMTLGNIMLLTNPELAGLDISLEDGCDEVFLIRSEAAVTGEAGDGVSLIPLGGPVTGIETQGLYYPLKGETLIPHQTRGISNGMVEAVAAIRVQSGMLLCVHTRQRHSQQAAEEKR